MMVVKVVIVVMKRPPREAHRHTDDRTPTSSSEQRTTSVMAHARTHFLSQPRAALVGRGEGVLYSDAKSVCLIILISPALSVSSPTQAPFRGKLISYNIRY